MQIRRKFRATLREITAHRARRDAVIGKTLLIGSLAIVFGVLAVF